MSRITRAEKWFGKKKKDLNEEERKEFEKLYSQEVKQYQVEYHKKWRKENPEKVKEYYTKYNNENKTLKEENDKLKQQIADLESKLAEHNEYFRSFSCENFNEFQDFISTFMLTPHEEQTLIRELKQQLAEKEKELYLTKDTLQHHTNIYNNLMSDLKTIKIDYAVEKVERVKSFCSSAEDNGWCVTHKDWLDIVEFINQLITEIKEGK